MPGWKILQYEKVKHEKQRRTIMYMLFGQYVYIYISIAMCNLCIELSIIILLLKFAISAILPGSYFLYDSLF